MVILMELWKSIACAEFCEIDGYGALPTFELRCQIRDLKTNFTIAMRTCNILLSSIRHQMDVWVLIRHIY